MKLQSARYSMSISCFQHSLSYPNRTEAASIAYKMASLKDTRYVSDTEIPPVSRGGSFEDCSLLSDVCTQL